MIVALQGFSAMPQVWSCLYDRTSSNQKTARLTDEKKSGLTHISAALCFWSNKLSASTCLDVLSDSLRVCGAKEGAATQEVITKEKCNITIGAHTEISRDMCCLCELQQVTGATVCLQGERAMWR